MSLNLSIFSRSIYPVTLLIAIINQPCCQELKLQDQNQDFEPQDQNFEVPQVYPDLYSLV